MQIHYSIPNSLRLGEWVCYDAMKSVFQVSFPGDLEKMICYMVFRTVVLSLSLYTEKEIEAQRMQKWVGSEASSSGVARPRLEQASSLYYCISVLECVFLKQRAWTTRHHLELHEWLREKLERKIKSLGKKILWGECGGKINCSRTSEQEWQAKL